jgi:hypothetical protein
MLRYMHIACLVPSLRCLFGQSSQAIYTMREMTSSPAALGSPSDFILYTPIAEMVLNKSIETLGCLCNAFNYPYLLT